MSYIISPNLKQSKNYTITKISSHTNHIVPDYYYPLAYRPATRTFLRGYLVASLPRALHSQKFSKKKVCLNRLEML